MSSVRPLAALAFLPLFSGCQLMHVFSEQPVSSETRFQGEVTERAGQLLFKPCQGKSGYVLQGDAGTDLAATARALLTDSGQPLFADLSGTPEAGSPEGSLLVSRVYRLQGEGPGCSDPNFKRLLLRAHGNEPGWNINVSSRGMVLERIGQPALALPYLEERLPDGSSSITTDADGLKLELWLTPQHCTDSMTGGLEHLSAELSLNGEILRGCAAYGAMRSD